MGKVEIRSKRTNLEESLQAKSDTLQAQIDQSRKKWKALQQEREDVLTALKGWNKALAQALAYIQKSRKTGGVSENAFELGNKMIDEAFDHIEILQDRVDSIETEMDAVSDNGKETVFMKGQLEVQNFRNQFSHHRSNLASDNFEMKPVEGSMARRSNRENLELSYSIDALIELRNDADRDK